MEFLILDVTQTIPDISANGYFKISKRLLPQVNFKIKQQKQGFSFCLMRFGVGAGDWHNPYLFLHSLPV